MVNPYRIALGPADKPRRPTKGLRTATVALVSVGLGVAAGSPAGASTVSDTALSPAEVSAKRSVTSMATSMVTTMVTTASANSRIATVLPARTTDVKLGSNFTMTVWDTAEGRYVYTKSDAASLRGASTAKLFTSAAVLQTLGAEHRMPTRVLSGRPGEVVLRAGGDPLLTSADLRLLASMTATALKAGGSAATSATPTPSGTSNPSSTGTQIPIATPLTGATSGISTAPTTPRQTASATVTTTASKPATQRSISVVVRADDSLFPGYGQSRGWPNSFMPWQVRPVNAFARDDNKVRDATADAGRFFARALASYGIQASYGGEATAPAGARNIATFPGHTVGAAVSRALLISDNDTAEMLFRQVAVGTGHTADWNGARTATRQVLSGLGIPLTGVEIVDGSGLSLENRLTAGALTAVLAQALVQEKLAGLRGWLPVAGRTGSLSASAGRFNTAPSKCAAGQIRAKTGTLADAIALAGYATGADGTTKIVVAVVNSRPTRYSRLTTRRTVDGVVSGVTGCW